MKVRSLLFVLLAAVPFVSCDDETPVDDPSGPSANPTSGPAATPRPAGNNRPPVITGLDKGPGNPVLAGATNVSFGAFASDPDGDPLTYTWEFGDGDPDVSGVGQTGVSRTFYRDRTFNVKLTVSDGRGGTATTTTQVVAVTLDGEWRLQNARGFGIGVIVSHSGGRSLSGRFTDGSTFSGNVSDPFNVNITLTEANDLCIRSGQYRGSADWPNLNSVSFGGAQCRGFAWLR